MNVVKLDANGEFCIKSSASADGTIVDVLGYLTSSAQPFRRIVDTRTTGAAVGSAEMELVVGAPNSVFVGTVVSTGPSRDGWLAAFTDRGGYNGTSTVNSDGLNSLANLVIMKTDANGAIHFRAMDGMTTHVVVDGTTVPELAPFLTADGRRIEDTRDDGPFVVPACSLLLWFDNGDNVKGRSDDFHCL